MSFKSKVLAAAATLTMVGGVGTMGVLTAGTAGAATPSCGPACINIFSRDFGTFRHPNFTVDVLRQGAKVGQPIILFKHQQLRPGAGLVASFQGHVSDFCAAGLVSAADLHYGGGAGHITPTRLTFPDLPALESSTRRSALTAACAWAWPPPPARMRASSLQPCGVSGKTVWIGDSLDNPFSFYVPVINGSNTNFSHPFVLTYPANGYPTDKPRPQLQVRNLTGFTQPGGIFPVITSVNSNQLWSATFGVLR